MTNALQTLSTNNNAVNQAGRELGTPLRSVDMTERRRLLTPDEVAMRRCKTSPEFKSGPYAGFRQVVAKNPNDPNGRVRFLQSIADIDGRMLLRPYEINKKMYMLRTLVKFDPATQAVNLTSFGAQASLRVSDAERTVLSAVNGYYDPSIGTHKTGPVRSEPGHVALTGAVLLGGYTKNPTTSLHDEIHTFEHRRGVQGNILAASTANAALLGVPMPSESFTFEQWPTKEMLLWHPDEITAPQAPLQDDAVARVQAAGFVALKDRQLVGQAVNALGSM